MGIGLFRRLLGKGEPVTAANATVPEDMRVYAVGDIHGRDDLLRRLHQSIRADGEGIAPNLRRVIVYLGDYIDRGFHSREVIDLLLDNPLDGIESVYLKGNHEEQFLSFFCKTLPPVGRG